MSKVSVIIPFYNAQDYISEAMDSLIKQDYPFGEIDVFLIDDGSTDDSKDMAESYSKLYKNVIKYRLQHKGVSAARNVGIELALQTKNEYIFFLDADDKYRKNHIKKCIEILEKYPESVFATGVIELFEADEGLDKRFSLARYKREREIEISDNVTDSLYCGHVGQGGWRAEALIDKRFNEKFVYAEDVDFMSRVLSKNKFVFCKDIKYLYRKRYTSNSIVDTAPEDIRWYDKVWKVFKPLYEDLLKENEFVPFFVQQTVLENIYALFTNNDKEKILERVNHEQLNKAMEFIMENTDDEIINCKLFADWQRMHFKTYKYGKPNLTRWAPLPTFVMNKTGETDAGERFGYLSTDPMVVHIIFEKTGTLVMRTSIRCLTYEHFQIDVISDYETDVQQVPSPFDRDKMFFCGQEIFPRKYFEIKINLNAPIKDLTEDEEGYVRFFMKTDYGVLTNIRLDFLPHSGMGYNMPFTLGDDFIIKRTETNNTISASPFTEKELLTTCNQIKPYGGIGTPHPDSVKKFTELKNSIIQNFRAFSEKRIWLFIDRGYDIGNNAEALFRHCVTKNDGILKYYIIPDESFADRFAGLPYMVIGSLEYKLLCCFAEKFFSSYLFGGGLTYNFTVNKKQKELWEDTQNFKKLARTFFRGDIIHVQHGVIMQDISYYLTKFDENLKTLLNVSEKEYNYIKNDLSNAMDSNMLSLTGLPRLDLLEHTKNNPDSQKIILFAPSFDWKYFKEMQYIPEYKHSEHFQYLNSVLNSSKLLDGLEKKGYKLYFKPHYLVVPMLDDFDIDPRVTVVTNEIDRYELYAMADLMISDYSGIAFDFAYLKKPVVYAHFVEPKYEEVYFSYKDDGFGEICKDIASLEKKVLKYVAHQCEMPPKYQQRVDGFYSMQDGQNCERIYQEMIKLPDTRKNIFVEGGKGFSERNCY